MACDDHDFILKIYEAAATPDRWQSVLDEFADRVNAKGCILFNWDGHGAGRRLSAPHHSSFHKTDTLLTYLDKCFEYEARDQDIFEAHSLQTDAIDLIDDSVLAPDVDSLKRLKNVEVLQKFGLLHRAAGLLNKDDRSGSRFSVQYGVERGPPTRAERATMSVFLPHIAKALDLGRPADQLARQNQSLLAAMDRLTIGVCILDTKGRVVLKNKEFDRQTDSYPLIRLQRDGKLKLARPEDQARFDHLIAHASNHGKFGARPRKEAISATDDTYLCVEAAPLHSAEALGSKPLGGCIVFSTDTSLPVHCNTAPMQQVYGLTDTELSIVDAIGEGLTNTQIADRRDRSVATINAQVKSILNKTNCKTRTQFVRLMMSFSANYIRGPEA